MTNTECTLHLLPFYNIENDQLFLSAINEMYAQRSVPLDFESLNEMTYNVFELDFDDIMNELNDLDPDLCYYNQLISNTNSNYYSEESFNRTLAQSSSNNLPFFSILHANIRSFFANRDSLCNLLPSTSNLVSIICLSETWLTPDNADLATIDGYDHESRVRLHKTGGGVSVFISNTLKHIVRGELSAIEPHIECIFVEIDKGSLSADRNVIVGCIYRPPKASIVDFNESLKITLDTISKENKFLYLTGDFNIDLLSTSQNTYTPASEFTELLFSYSVFPTINKPTRITSSSATIIDNVFVNNLHNQVITSGIIASDVSDHCPIFCSTPFSIRNNDSDKYISKRTFNDNSRARFSNMLEQIDWNQSLHESECQSAFTSFYNEYKRCFDTCFPLRRVKLGYKNRKVWLSAGLKESIKKKNKLYCIYLKSKNETDKHVYFNYKRRLRSLMRSAERNHYDDMFSQCQGNLRKSWGIIKEIINKHRDSSRGSEKTFLIDGANTSDKKTICNAFNKFFVNIGPNLANTIPQSNTNPTSLLERNSSTMFARPTNEVEIQNIIRDLRNSAPGPDNIPAAIIKHSAMYIGQVLSHIINLSLSEGVVPDELKIAQVKPLFKSGDASQINNYRPISLLPCFSKILEKCMATRLFEFIDRHSILYKYQFGFRPKHNTSMALHHLVDKVVESLDSSQSIVGVALDFRKAFDTVDHTILLGKLYEYGIRGSLHHWFASYLHGRRQFVSWLGADSTTSLIRCGVPQGSILGPILFLLYINDLPRSCSLTSIIYADDTNLFVTGRNIEECINKINTNSLRLLDWIHSNKLSLNLDKTQYIVFSKRKTPPTQHKLLIDGHIIQRVPSMKFLGVYIDEHLSWRCHISYIRGKVSRSLGMLRCAKPNLNQNTMVTLYYCFIYPYINYCIDVWGQCSEDLFLSIFRTQKKAVRLISSSHRRAHTATIFNRLNILPLRCVYIYSCALFMFKHHHHLLPAVMSELFSLNTSVHHINTRQRTLLHVPRLISTFSKKSIRYRGVFIWNQIPTHPCSIDIDVSVSSFKSSLRLLLVNNNNAIRYNY